MTCLSELTWAVYVDGELSPDEARDAERHLAECAPCRALVAALRGENRVLAVALDESPTLAPASAPAVRPAPVLDRRELTTDGRRAGAWRLVVAALVATSGLAGVVRFAGWGV
jgi:anti-sigma factor RsiW